MSARVRFSFIFLFTPLPSISGKPQSSFSPIRAGTSLSFLCAFNSRLRPPQPPPPSPQFHSWLLPPPSASVLFSLMENGDELGANEAQIPQKGISPDKISFGKWRLFLPHILPHFLFLSFLHLGNELFLRLVMLLQCGVGRVASPHSAVRSRVNESIERR